MAETTVLIQPRMDRVSLRVGTTPLAAERRESESAVAPDLAAEERSPLTTVVQIESPARVRAIDTAADRTVTGKIGFDVVWNRELNPGSLSGGHGLRLKAKEPFEVVLPATGNPVVRLSPPRDEMDHPLLQALFGIHPLEWVLDVVLDVGSRQWKALAEETQIPVRELDAFQQSWRTLGAVAQAELWNIADDPRAIENLSAAVERSQGPDWSHAQPSTFKELLTSTSMRSILSALHHYVRWHLGSERIVPALRDPEAFERLPLWVRNRLSQAVTTWGPGVCPALQAHREDLQALAARIYSMVRESLAETLAQEYGSGSGPAVRNAGERYVTVVLPFQHRKLLLKKTFDWRTSSLARAGATTLMVVAGGKDPMLHWTESAVVYALSAPFRQGAAALPGPDSTLGHDYQRTGDSEWSDPFWNSLLDNYGFDAPATAAATASGQPAKLSVEMPLDWLDAWARIPGHREAGQHAALTNMAVSVQRHLRLWISALAFDSPEKLADRRTSLPFLIYAATEPFWGDTRGQLTYEPMSERDHGRALRTAKKNLPSLMEMIVQHLQRAGCAAAAERYERMKTDHILSWITYRPRQLATFFALEFFIVEELVRLTDRVRELRGLVGRPGGFTLREAHRFAERMANDVSRKLERVAGVDCTAAAPFLIIAATAALHTQGCADYRATLQGAGKACSHMLPTMPGRLRRAG